MRSLTAPGGPPSSPPSGECYRTIARVVSDSRLIGIRWLVPLDLLPGDCQPIPKVTFNPTYRNTTRLCPLLAAAAASIALGTSYLSMPYVFATLGLASSVVVAVLVVLLSNEAFCTYIAATARAQANYPTLKPPERSATCISPPDLTVRWPHLTDRPRVAQAADSRVTTFSALLTWAFGPMTASFMDVIVLVICRRWPLHGRSIATTTEGHRRPLIPADVAAVARQVRFLVLLLPRASASHCFCF